MRGEGGVKFSFGLFFLNSLTFPFTRGRHKSKLAGRLVKKKGKLKYLERNKNKKKRGHKM